jgi:hypothetical protein
MTKIYFIQDLVRYFHYLLLRKALIGKKLENIVVTANLISSQIFIIYIFELIVFNSKTSIIFNKFENNLNQTINN